MSVDSAALFDLLPAILFITIYAAVITPSQDPFTQLAMMVPMYVFYELSILVARALKR